jgi:hypothetical protein
MPIKMHPSITLARIVAAVEEAQTDCSNPGFCLHCGKRAVYGAEEILLMLA